MTQGVPHRDRLELAAVPSAAGSARHWTQRRIVRYGFGSCAGISDTAALVVSELVTNAIRASTSGLAANENRRKGEITLTVGRVADSLRIEVFDPDFRSEPRRRECDLDAQCGRGLMLIESLGAAWGWSAVPGGKVVWCEIAVAAPSLAAPSPVAASAAAAESPASSDRPPGGDVSHRRTAAGHRRARVGASVG